MILGEAIWRLRRRWWLARHGGPSQRQSAAAGEALAQLFQLPPATTGEMRASLQAWCEHYLRHEFDLLGSGWTQVRAGRAAPAADYAPIDWQLDFKSGHRWSEKTWHRDIRFGDVAGVDVKVPWELARMQHLPQLAFAALAGIVPLERAAREFQLEVLDFKTANPPGWGVNWVNAMEAAIRAANWLIAADLLRGAGHRFEAAFAAELRAAIVEHGRHIAANLEWHPRYRGNHYLANLAGLVFCGAWLDGGEADAWLAFGIRGIEEETARQFNADGGGFEASTCYHALSGEVITYATTVALALPRARLERLAQLPETEICPQHGLRVRTLAAGAVPFSSSHFEALHRIARFTLAVTKPDGRVVQIGDNDSGRFAKLSWALRDGREDHLDHRHLVDAIRALPYARPGAEETPLEAHGMSWEDALHEVGAASRTRVLARGPGLTDNLACCAFPDFGLYILRSERLWLSIRCGESGMEPLGAHAHNDQLALELAVDGKDVIRDPGSYLYTPAPELRNAYRSAAAHDVPRLAGREPASLDEGLFLLRGRTGARCLHFSRRGFAGLHRGYGAPVWRLVSLSDDELKVEDGSGVGALDGNCSPPPFSPGYGLREA